MDDAAVRFSDASPVFAQVSRTCCHSDSSLQKFWVCLFAVLFRSWSLVVVFSLFCFALSLEENQDKTYSNHRALNFV